MAKITIKESGPTANIWVESSKGPLISIEADDRVDDGRVGIVFYTSPEHAATRKGVFAIVAEGGECQGHLQMHVHEGDKTRIVMVPIDKLAKILMAFA